MHKLEVSACAPTGIAYARIRIQRTPVRAFILHYLFGFNVAIESKLDPSKPEDERLLRLVKTQVLFTDDASMIGGATWFAVKDQLTTVGAVASATREAGEMPPGDEFGNVHHIICCDFKQLPPATSRPPFIASDPAVLATFDFRVLKENRRLAVGTDVSHQRSLDAFHTTLERIARGDAGVAVRRFFVEAYARGAGATASRAPFEDHMAVTAKLVGYTNVAFKG